MESGSTFFFVSLDGSHHGVPAMAAAEYSDIARFILEDQEDSYSSGQLKVPYASDLVGCIADFISRLHDVQVDNSVRAIHPPLTSSPHPSVHLTARELCGSSSMKDIFGVVTALIFIGAPVIADTVARHAADRLSGRCSNELADLLGVVGEPEPIEFGHPLPYFEPLLTQNPPPSDDSQAVHSGKRKRKMCERAVSDPADPSTPDTLFASDDAIALVLAHLDARTLRNLKDVSRTWWYHARATLGDPKSLWRQQPNWSGPSQKEVWGGDLNFAAEVDEAQLRKALKKYCEMDAAVELPRHAADLLRLYRIEKDMRLVEQLARLERQTVQALHLKLDLHLKHFISRLRVGHHGATGPSRGQGVPSTHA